MFHFVIKGILKKKKHSTSSEGIGGSFYFAQMNEDERDTNGAYIFLIWLTPGGTKPLGRRENRTSFPFPVSEWYVPVPSLSFLVFSHTSHHSVILLTPFLYLCPPSPLLPLLFLSCPLGGTQAWWAELKLRYKVIRQWMHFWLQCAFYTAPSLPPLHTHTHTHTHPQPSLSINPWAHKAHFNLQSSYCGFTAHTK